MSSPNATGLCECEFGNGFQNRFLVFGLWSWIVVLIYLYMYRYMRVFLNMNYVIMFDFFGSGISFVFHSYFWMYFFFFLFLFLFFRVCNFDHPLSLPPKPYPYPYPTTVLPTYLPYITIPYPTLTLTLNRPFQDWFFMSCTMIHLRLAAKCRRTNLVGISNGHRPSLLWRFTMMQVQAIDRDSNRSRRFFATRQYQVHVLAVLAMLATKYALFRLCEWGI